jgi:hypothetical protein
MSPSVIATTYIRNLYRRIYPLDVPVETAQAEMSPMLLVGRMAVPPALDAKFNKAYNHERLPLCARIPGYMRAQRFAAVMGEPAYLTVHEMASLDVRKSQAWEDWRTAVTPVWNGEVRAHMVHAEGSPGCIAASSPRKHPATTARWCPPSGKMLHEVTWRLSCASRRAQAWRTPQVCAVVVKEKRTLS